MVSRKKHTGLRIFLSSKSTSNFKIMAWSFSKKIKIIPGVQLNLNKSGLSTAIAIKDASMTFGRIFSAEVHKITNQNLQGVKEAIILAHQQRKELKHDILSFHTALGTSKFKRILSYLLLYGLIFKHVPKNLTADIAAQEDAINQTKAALENCYVSLEVDFDSEIKGKYDNLVNAFKKLATSHKIWDITSAHFQDRVIARSSASTIVNKQEVKFSLRSIPDVRSNYEALYFQNANGADLYCYPSFIIVYSNETDFAIIGIDEINLQQRAVRFTETEAVPADSKVIDKTWAKVNKNGTPDKRFNGNYQIPIVRYGEIRLSTPTGLNEEYEFSNDESAEEFGNVFKEYQIAIKRSKTYSMSGKGVL
jgi:hypothetical protein